jgi:hypothetical protein
MLAAGVAALGLAIILITSLGGTPVEEQRAQRYVTAWARGDYRAMYDELTPSARRARPAADFAAAHRRALATATATRRHPRARRHEDRRRRGPQLAAGHGGGGDPGRPRQAEPRGRSAPA